MAQPDPSRQARSPTGNRLPLEDRQWPIYAAILVLAGLVGAVVVRTGDFADPRPLLDQRLLTSDGWLQLAANGWVQLILLALVAGALGWLAAAAQRLVARRVQFSLLLSLLVHLCLAIALYGSYLTAPSELAAPPPELAHALERPVVPEYFWEHAGPAPPRQEFETPLATPTPEPSNPLPVLEPEPVTALAPPLKAAPAEAEIFPPRLDAEQIRRAMLSAPRRDEALGGPLSRQETKHLPEPGQPSTVPALKADVVPEVSAPRLASVQRQAPTPRLPEGPRPEAAVVPGPSLEFATRGPVRSEPLRPLPEPSRDVPKREKTPVAAWAEVEPAAGPLRAAPPEQPQVDARDLPISRRVSAPGPEKPRDAFAALPWLVAAQPLSPHPLRRAHPAPVRSAPEPSPLPPIARQPAPDPQAVVRPGGLPSAPSGPGGRTGQAAGSAEAGSVRGGGQPEAPSVAGAGAASAASGQRAAPPGGMADATPAPGRVEPPSRPAEPGKLDVSGPVGIAGPQVPGGGLPVLIAAAPGAGGLGAPQAPSLGIPDRRARPESDLAHSLPQRFMLARSGTEASIDPGPPVPPAEPFRARDPHRRGEAGRSFGGTPSSEQAVQRGILYLARHQFPDGHWSLDRFPQSGREGYERAAPGQMNGDTAATGLALLAFLGAGYTHREDAHRAVVGRGIDWLLRNQQPNGQLFTPQTDTNRFTRFYGHAIATIALCEAYGMTRDPKLLEPARKAVEFIVQSQHPQHGGWRYDAGSDSDTSVSGWKLMALTSAQMAGLEVPAATLQKVSQWLDAAQAEGGARYVYNPHAAVTPQERAGREPNLPMTAEGLLMRMFLGWDHNTPALAQGAAHLMAHPPALGTAAEPLRDVYYWYYATQVMFHLQGDGWTAWRQQLFPMLEDSQVQNGPLAGSWDPDRPVPDRWAEAAGRHYVTVLNLLMLEAPYRHLPLYRLPK